MVGGVGDKSLREFVQGDSDGGLETDAHKCIFGHVMVVLRFEVFRRVGFTSFVDCIVFKWCMCMGSSDS